MITVLLVLQVFVTLALIGVVLIQRSEGGGLGLGTSQGMGSFMTGRGTATLLTRTTAVLAALFFILSIALAMLYKHSGGSGAESILDHPPAAQAPVTLPGAKPVIPTAPAPSGMAVPLPTTPAPTAPAAPKAPAAPATKSP
jgi:preprotein translocase subunit SecG